MNPGKAVLQRLLLLIIGLLCPAQLRGDEAADAVAQQLATIARVGPQGAGSPAARAARDDLARSGVAILPPLVAAMDTSNPVAANWYRTIFEEVVRRSLEQQETVWPREFLEEFVNDVRHAGRPRELVVALLERLEPGFRERWLPARVDDPAFRYDAVSLVLARGELALREKDGERAKTEFRNAFEHSRDSGQITQAATHLKALGEPADVVAHLGLVVDWWLVGPFDAPGETGFAATFAPETDFDLSAKYSGQSGEGIRWIRHSTTDPLGQLNLITALAATREAVAYAYSEVDLPHQARAQLRCGADDNCTVWLNGQKVFAREQWLNGTRLDRFITDVTLRQGRNKLLVKVCQGPQHKDPDVPNNWSLQLRLCDDTGKGVEFKSAL